MRKYVLKKSLIVGIMFLLIISSFVSSISGFSKESNQINVDVEDFNELKALTKVGMGACGAKTCNPLISRIFQEEGIIPDDYTPGTKRPLFIEVPMGIFAKAKDKKEGA